MHKIVFLGLSLLVSAQLLAAEPPLRTDLNEQVVMLPVDKNFLGLSIELETTIFKPQGNGPFPLIVLNDGLDFGNPAFQPRARYTVVAEELVARGYVVALPMPRGVGKSTGTMIAASCDIGFLAEKNGKDTVNAIAQLKKLPFIDGNKIIVAGQSYGGLNTLAAASNDIAGLQLAVNFAGGLKYMSKDLTVAVCDWQKSLLEATAKFGASSKVESLWFYGQNDSLFPPDLVVKMRDAYQKGGAKVDLLQYGEFRKDAHGMFGTQVGFDTIWWPKLSAALQAKGLPTERLYPKSTTVVGTGYAKVDEIEKLPKNLKKACIDKYQSMQVEGIVPRAFAISAEGGCGFAADYDDTQFWAMQGCKAYSKSGDCKLYLVNDQVVWPKS
jgi:dienelactone hydrolase